MLLAEFLVDYGFYSKSHITSVPRPGEHMDDYNLVSRVKIHGDTDAGPVLEHAEVHENHYGLSILAVQEDTQNGRRCLLDFEVKWSAIYFIAEPL